jgi:hypothetical protein
MFLPESGPFSVCAGKDVKLMDYQFIETFDFERMNENKQVF